MNFNEAMYKLYDGNAVTRRKWENERYFVLEGTSVLTYQPTLRLYQYDEDIIVSKGWLIDDVPIEYSFSEIIPFLAKGSKAKLNTWKDMYIYLDGNSLVLHAMEKTTFIPQFSDFVANDWMILA